MKMTSKTINLVPPSGSPDSFCRLCFSKTRVKLLTATGTLFGQNAVQVIDKHLGIQLSAGADGDFPCGLCQICEEKLEELNLCNDDGLLDEWQDEDLLEYKASCIAVDEAIRNKRSKGGVKATAAQATGEQRIVLPFHKLNDGRYKCNVCPDKEFEFISACIKHYQEMHPVSTLSDISTEPAQNSAIRGEKQSFNCVSCSERFDNIDALIEHREANHQRLKKRKAGVLEEPVVEGDSVVETAPPPFLVAQGEVQYYQCIVCSAVVGSVMSLLEHRLLHVLDRSKQTADRWLCDPANITVTNGFKCPYCIEQFVESKAYYFHLNTMHKKNLCNFCGESSPSSTRQIQHQRTHQTSNGGAFVCELCSIDFFTQAELDDHRLHHQTLIPIEADESVLPVTDDCYFLDGQNNDECILSDDHQEGLQNGDLVEDACTKVVEISDDED